MAAFDLEINDACQSGAERPPDHQLMAWATAVMLAEGTNGSAHLEIVDEAAARALNLKWRGIDKPTNVLSFPRSEGDLADIVDDEHWRNFLGDMVICADVVAREAGEYGRSLEFHWAHILVHGCFHLLGFDHLEPADAERMEARETEVLEALGFDAPYDDPAHT